MCNTVHTRGHIQWFLQILFRGRVIKGENGGGGGKGDETFFSTL
jgi:hypothetical protein